MGDEMNLSLSHHLTSDIEDIVQPEMVEEDHLPSWKHEIVSHQNLSQKNLYYEMVNEIVNEINNPDIS